MSLRVLFLTILMVLCAPFYARTQTTAPDIQAVTLLSQSLAASGVTSPVKPVEDFTATGTITYFWAGEEVKGSATVRGRGPGQWRLDADLPEGYPLNCCQPMEGRAERA